MDAKTAVFTVIAKNYLPQARVLMASAAEIHPEWERFVVLVDEVNDYFDPAAENFTLVLSSELPIPRSRWFHFKYSTLELCTAVKPYSFEHLFRSHGLDRIVYLDPDIRIYSRFQRVTDALETADIVLTPHLTSPLDDDMRPGEIDILRAGAYNLGFIAIAWRPVGGDFLRWWQQRLYDHCVVDLPRGLFVDQRWIDLAPGMFESVSIIRDPGYNVAYWNLSHRVISHEGPDSTYKVAESPLAFFHFSGYDPEQPDRLSRHQNRFSIDDLPPATQHLLTAYRDALIVSGYMTCKAWPNVFEFFANGTRIPDAGRPVHLEAPELLQSIEDPFSDAGFKAFIDTWNSPLDDEHSRTGISRLVYRIYRTRSDVQSAMPDIFDGHYRAFVEWVLSRGRIEHGLGDIFLTTLVQARETTSKHQKARTWPEASRPDELTDDLKGSGSSGPRLQLTRLAVSIYNSRPELQRYFPDPCGQDSVRFLVWLLTYGRKEHHLSPANLAPLKAQWRSVLSGLPDRRARARYELVRRGMSVSIQVREAVQRLTAWRARSGSHHAAIPQKPEPPLIRQYGVNLVGYFQSETGVGQTVRAARLALQSASVPLSLCRVPDSGPCRQLDNSAGAMSAVFPYSTNLFYVNADQTLVVKESLGEPFYRNCTNIGYWVWELDEFPDKWQDAFAPYQEIWTPSMFCREAVARKTSLPVFCFPYSVAPVVAPGLDRSHFGLPADKFLFLTAFDVLSVPERKNPLAVIRAFEKAFGANPYCQLIVKVNNAHARPRYVEMLRNAATGGSVRILDSTYRRDEMDALTNCADCIVSLHRSEGFGLLIAEGMYMGKPVIVTNYSGNVDFTLPDNSLLVDYRMIPVGAGNAPYNPASRWADPDVDHAAAHMKALVENADLRGRLSVAGQRFVREKLSAETLGKAMRERIDAVSLTKQIAKDSR